MRDPLLSLLQTAVVALTGLQLGSFVNAVAWRIREGTSWLRGFSMCPHCGKRILHRDLMPIVSFLLLRGRCRFCSKPIGWHEPLGELGVALALTAAWVRLGWGVPLLVAAVMLLFLAVLFVLDLRYEILPDAVTIPGLTFALIGGLLFGHTVADLFLGGILGALFFLLQFVLSHGTWIGGGDIRLGALIGLLLGWQGLLLVLFLSYTSGALVGLVLIAQKRKTLRSHIPFGTFLTASTFVALLYGPEIIAWYVSGGFS